MPAQIKAFRQSGLTFPWAEFTADGDSSEASFSNNGARAVLTIEIDQKTFQGLGGLLPGKILGYPTLANGKMHRNLPWRHPIWTWLYASEITSIKGLSYIGGTDQGTTTWQRYLITVVFTAPPWDILPDTAVATEDQRYTEYLTIPRVEMIALDTGAFSVQDAGAGGLNGHTVRANVGIRIPKVYYKYVWQQVPANYILNTNGFPSNLLASLATVNDATFRGNPSQTLLCDSVDLVTTMCPVSPGVLFGGGANTTVPRTYTVTINYIYMNPTTTSAVARGWLLYPTPANTWFYIATTIGNTPQYQSSTFANMWLPAA